MLIRLSSGVDTIKILSVFFLIGLSTVSCRSSNFKGNTGVKKALPPALPLPQGQSMNLTCSVNTAVSQTVTQNISASEISLNKRDSLKFTGEFCPKTSSSLNVVFILDQSGSMANNDPGNAFSGCGRSKAVSSILDTLKSYNVANNAGNIKYGIINFSSSAQTITPLTQVTTDVNFNSISAGLRSCGQSGATNYKSAFDLANSMFSGVEGTKIIYFITDGLPQYAGASSATALDPRAAADGENSVSQIRSKFSDLIINAIYLGDSATEDQKQERITYLAKLTADANRVKYVDDSKKLADEIKQFALPSVQLSKDSVTAKLKSQNSNEQISLKIVSFLEKTGSKDVYSFELAPFDFGAGSNANRFQLILDAKDAQNKIYNQSYDVKIKLVE